MIPSSAEADEPARRLALTALDRTLMVEAGAGSGKTSLLAGRVVALLAAGRPPASIAAITFTELAASELRERIGTFADELLGDGAVRPDLRPAFGEGCTVEQRRALARGRADLDALSCSTIHGFCQTLLTPYPVEADMDPGAAVMDREQADGLFEETLDAALRERLDGSHGAEDALVAFFMAEPSATRDLVRTFATRLRSQPDLRVPSHHGTADPRRALRTRIEAFRGFIDGAPCHEPDTCGIVAALEVMADNLPRGPVPSPADVLQLLGLEVPACCATKAGAFRAYQFKGRWKAAAKASRTSAEAERLNDEAAARYSACQAAFDALKGWAATRALQLVERDCRAVVDRFAEAKRAAAGLDFDDLLLKARDLLARRPDVRVALQRRFASVLVDEFQDTDPLQVEILWRLAGAPPEDDATASWDAWPVRPGALFLVGDPKQAIYRFRNADVASYVAVRDRLRSADPGSVIAITRNFRSVPGILDWVNQHFEGPLGVAGQPGFMSLFPAVPAGTVVGEPPVVALPIETQGDEAETIRDAEAEAVAALCATLIGARQVRHATGLRACEADDIALLAPTGTDLWRYEQALEERGIAVSTQAGKGFFRRQEVHDLVALTRALADARDTLALGALLRGPLVGLTEEELLDAAADLQAGGTSGSLGLWTPTDALAHPLLRETLKILQGLARRAASTTPYVLLCAAVEELQVRPIVRRRRARTAERALGNIDLFLELARPYDVRGLRAFAAGMRRQWEEATRAVEARPDTERPAVSLITMHSAKGLEFPVVIPINTATEVRDRVTSAVDPVGRVLHMRVFGHHPNGSLQALEAESVELERERHRIWYVAATRARDLLVMPDPNSRPARNTWLSLVAGSLHVLEAVDVQEVEDRQVPALAARSGPDKTAFAAQAAVIAAGERELRRVTPHLAEGEDPPDTGPVILGRDDAPAASAEPLRGSRERGLILHKLLEEVLTGETDGTQPALSRRAAELRRELGLGSLSDPDPAEMAGAVLRGLSVPEVAAVRTRLVPECPVMTSRLEDGHEAVTLGVADAVALDGRGRPSLVVDWKSDVAPSADAIGRYRAQVGAYLDATGASAGLLVFLTSGRVEKVAATQARGRGPVGPDPTAHRTLVA